MPCWQEDEKNRGAEKTAAPAAVGRILLTVLTMLTMLTKLTQSAGRNLRTSASGNCKAAPST